MAQSIPQPQQQLAAPGQQAQPNAEPEVIRNLMVNYIPTTIDEMQLRQLFEMYGPIESLKIVCDRETRQSRGYGFVKYRFSFSAVHAIQYLNGYPLMNKRLKVAYANAAEAQKASVGVDAGAYAQQQQMQQQVMPQMNPFAQQQQQFAALQMVQYQQAQQQAQQQPMRRAQ